MKLRGEGFIQAPVERVWQYLHDPAVLREITPFVRQLEQVEGSTYTTESEVKVGPIRGTFRGKLRIEDIEPLKEFVVILEQGSTMGNSTVQMRIRLVEEDDGTRIEYEGDARMSGLLARMGQRLIGSTVKKVAGEFFTNLQHRLQEDWA